MQERYTIAWLLSLANLLIPPAICTARLYKKPSLKKSSLKEGSDVVLLMQKPGDPFPRELKPRPSICCADHYLKIARSAVQPGQRLHHETFRHEGFLPFLRQCLKPVCWQPVFPAIHCRSISFLISKSTWKSSIVS